MSDFNERHGKDFKAVFGEDNQLSKVPSKLKEKYKDAMMLLRANQDLPVCFQEKHVSTETLALVLEHSGFDVTQESLGDADNLRVKFKAVKSNTEWTIWLDDRYGVPVVGDVEERQR